MGVTGCSEVEPERPGVVHSWHAAFDDADLDGAKLRVLIVDDHTMIAQGLALALRLERIAPYVVSPVSADEIVAATEAVLPSLMILDIRLGDAVPSAPELIERVRPLGVPVLVLTGVTGRDELAACVEAGAVGVASKSDPFEIVLDLVVRACRGEEVLAQDSRDELLLELRAHRQREEARLAPFASLSAREREVLGALMEGASAKDIAAASFVSTATVRSQIHSVLKKLGVRSQLAAVTMAESAGWRPR